MKKKNSSNDKAYSRNGDWRFAWTIARREIRGSLVNFKAFLGALILGVAAIGTVGSVAEAMRAGIKDNARILLGGDIELSSIHQPPSDEILTEAKNYGKLSRVVQMRAMLEANGIRKLVELKAVDQNWPLVGEAKISPDHSTAQALAKFGVIADDTILKSLGLQLGDRATLGDLKVKVGGKLLSEPDRSISFVSFGPRLLISDKTLMATGLLQPGSFITYRFRLLLDNPQDRSFVLEKLNKKTSSTHVRVREVVGAAPGFNRFINQTEMFMVLVALTALLIGGLGVAGAVRAFLITRMQVIATLKCLGATSGLIFRIYLAQVLMITSVGLFVGTIVAVIAPLFAINELSQYVTVPMSLTIYPLPLTIAVSFGLFTALVFAIWPLAKAEEVRAGDLFRSLVRIPTGRPKVHYLLLIVLIGMALAGLAYVATTDLFITLSFIGGAIVTLILLSAIATTLVKILKLCPVPSLVPAMLAISNITRPGSPVRATIIAFGLGLSVLVMVSISESNIRRQIDTKISERAPDWFFIDIQSNQIGKFESIVQNTEGIKSFNKTPMLRGRVVKINGIPTSEITPPENSAWILRGDRAISWADEPPPGSNIVVGSWWPKDYNGEPLVSVSKDAADDFGLKINDTISINVLGKEIRAKIANLRKIDWQSFQINFVFVISSGVLEKAPHSWIATTHASEPKAVLAIENAVTSSFSNVSAISVKEAVATANQVIGLLGGALKLTAFVTLVSGVAVLAGTVASGETQRLSETVTLKVLGATRFSIGLAWLLEYMLLGLLTAIPAAIIGSIASWVLMEGFLQTKFYYDFWLVFSTTIFGAIGTAILGLVSAIRTLGKKTAPALREL